MYRRFAFGHTLTVYLITFVEFLDVAVGIVSEVFSCLDVEYAVGGVFLCNLQGLVE